MLDDVLFHCLVIFSVHLDIMWSGPKRMEIMFIKD